MSSDSKPEIISSSNSTSSSNSMLFGDVETVFFDCDDCLYQNEWKTAEKITVAISTFTKERLGISPEKAYALYQEHGTCLKGLITEGMITQFSNNTKSNSATSSTETDKSGPTSTKVTTVEDFLHEVHL